MPQPDADLADLANRLPAGAVSMDAADVEAHRRDLWPRDLLAARDGGALAPAPAAVVRAATEADVVAVLTWARERKRAVVPYGGGAGVLGAARPVREGSVALDLTRLDRVHEPHPTDHVVRVEPGVIGLRFEEFLEARGFTSGHYPQSMPLSTVGGFLATRSSGQASTRYGNIEDLVVALRVVLPDGSVLTTPALPRSSAGPSIPQLFLGSEGSLGVITEVTLKVFPTPPARRFAAYRFDDFAAGLDACRALVQRGARPAVLRLHDGPDAALALAAQGVPGADAGQPFLIAVVEGDAALADAEAAIVEASTRRAGAEALGAAPAEAWWGTRYALGERLQEIVDGGGLVDTLDVSAPWSRLGAVADAVRAAGEDAGVIVLAHASHFYSTGANLYFTLLGQGGVEEHARAWRAVLAAARSAGAGIAHHHGVGLARKREVEEEIGEAGLRVLRALKAALDPDDLLNPGKLLSPG